VFYFNNNTPAFNVSIDGGADVTVTPPGGASHSTYQVTGLANTTHTIRVTRIAGTCQIWGASVRGTTGRAAANFGSGSQTAFTFATFTAWYQYQAMVTHVAPKAAFVMFGTNDVIAASPVATFKANMTTIVNALSAIGGGIDVVMMSPIYATSAFDPYRDALYQVADTLDVPLIDWAHFAGGYTVAVANGLMADTNHPNKPGFLSMGANLARLVA
jgi:lysophospholipase L1-like esterase